MSYSAWHWWWLKRQLPIYAFPLILFVSLAFGIAGFCFVVAKAIADGEAHGVQARCAAVHGHIYNTGRDTLCLTVDNRVITD